MLVRGVLVVARGLPLPYPLALSPKESLWGSQATALLVDHLVLA